MNYYMYCVLTRIDRDLQYFTFGMSSRVVGINKSEHGFGWASCQWQTSRAV